MCINALPLDRFSWNFILGLPWIFVERLQISLKSDSSIGQTVWRPKYVCIVVSSAKHFVAWLQCDRNSFLCFHGNTQQFYVTDCHVSVYSSTNGMHCCISMATAVVNRIIYCVIRTLPVLFKRTPRSHHSMHFVEQKSMCHVQFVHITLWGKEELPSCHVLVYVLLVKWCSSNCNKVVCRLSTSCDWMNLTCVMSEV
jgi:hypothetical protein